MNEVNVITIVRKLTFKAQASKGLSWDFQQSSSDSKDLSFRLFL